MPGNLSLAARAISAADTPVYAKLFEIFNRHPKTMTRVTFWGISDRRSWRSRQRPLLFDAQLQPKPAYPAILDVATDKGATPQQ